jgi:hypothetical protein
MVALSHLSTLTALAFPWFVWGQDGLVRYLAEREDNIFSVLQAQLSPNASIILPNNPQIQTAAEFWDAYSEPSFQAIVEVTNEEDVQKTVR